MAQIQGGTTYSTGDQITAANLNALAANSVLLPGAVSEQTAAAIANLGDSVLGLQSGALKKMTVSQIGAATSQDLSAFVRADGTVAMSANLTLFSSDSLGALSAAPVSYVDYRTQQASASEVALASAVSKYISPDRLSSAFDSLKSTNGYQKLPGGLIIQWGTYTNAAYGTYTVNLPIPFPTSVLFVLGGAAGALNALQESDSSSAGKNGASLSSISVTVDAVLNATAWLAIGY